MMGKIERDNDVSPDEIGNCGATSDQWLFLTWRRADGAVPVTVRARATPLWRLENPSISGLRAGLVALPSSVCVPACKGGEVSKWQ